MVKEQQRKTNKQSTRRTIILFCICFVLGGIIARKWHIEVPKWLIVHLFGHSVSMISLVSLMLVLGVCMCAKALHRMRLETEALLKAKSEFPYYKHREAVEKVKALADVKKSSLLGGRIDALTSASGGKLPDMSALHEITLQRELGRWDSAGMNTIVSFLLILGILGTLTGVHSVLVKDVRMGLDIEKLAPALLPSAIAVGGTVLLIIMRARYSMRVSKYIAALDAFCIKEIIPKLTEDIQHKKDTTTATNVAEIDLLTSDKSILKDIDNRSDYRVDWTGPLQEIKHDMNELRSLTPLPTTPEKSDASEGSDAQVPNFKMPVALTSSLINQGELLPRQNTKKK